MNFYFQAKKMKSETIAHRRYLHKHAETGMILPKTLSYIENELKKLQIPYEYCGHGIKAQIGKGTKTFLLRCDMDALPMIEKSNLPFACPTGTEAHTCGHDLHTAMLLTAAALLKQQEHQLHGTVILMFQPGEELLSGALDMIQNGILSSPSVDAALSVHVGPSQTPGTFYYNSTAPLMASCDIFQITVTGKSSHVAYPDYAIDALSIASQIYLELKNLSKVFSNKDKDSSHTCSFSNITIGTLQGGKAFNIMAEHATLKGSFRTLHPDTRNLMKEEIQKVLQSISTSTKGRISFEILNHVPALICHPDFTEEMVSYIQNIDFPKLHGIPNLQTPSSDDFAQIAARVPSAYFFLAAGESGKDNAMSHSPEVRFNEDVLPFGSTILATCAFQWLLHHSSK